MQEYSGKKRRPSGISQESVKKICLDPSINESFNGPEQGQFAENNAEDYDSSDYMFDDQSQLAESQSADTPSTPFTPPQNVRTQGKVFKCTWEGCSKAFIKPAYLTSHLRSHRNERPYVCNYSTCNKTYLELKHLSRHIKGSHSEERQYRCNWSGCDKSFLTAARLNRHLESHKGRERFRCNDYPPCHQTFRKHNTLQCHIRAAHLGLAPYPCTQVDPVTQVVCEVGYDSAAALRKHTDRVHGPPRFWCDECSAKHNADGASKQASFTTKKELEKHISAEHSNCMFCDLKCSSESELQKHVEAFHVSPKTAQQRKDLVDKKTISCNYRGCDKTFTKQYNLLVHVRVFHEGQRFVCSQSTCDLFKSPDFAFWTGESACGKEFASKANLEDHIRTQHLGLPSNINSRRVRSSATSTYTPIPERNESSNDNQGSPIGILTGASYDQSTRRKYACTFRKCTWRFMRQYDLRRHVETKHPMTIEERQNYGIHFNKDNEDDETDGSTDSGVQSIRESENDDAYRDVDGSNAMQSLLTLYPKEILDGGMPQGWWDPQERVQAAELRRKQRDFWYPEEVETWLPPQ